MWVSIGNWFDMAARQWISKPQIWVNVAMISRVYVREGDDPGALDGVSVLDIRQLGQEYPLFIKLESPESQVLLAAIRADSITRVPPVHPG